MSSTLCSECMEDEHCNGKYEQCTCNCMTTTDSTSELRQIPEIIEKVYALAKQGKDCTEPAIRDMYALLAAQKQRWEAETLKMAVMT